MDCFKQHNYVISLISETKRRKHIEQEFGQQNIPFSLVLKHIDLPVTGTGMHCSVQLPPLLHSAALSLWQSI